MKSYIEIYGPPVLKAIKELEKIAINMPEVCIMDTIISGLMPSTLLGDSDATMTYFGGPRAISMKRCSNIISKSGETLGDYDFFFEWFKEPTLDELHNLIQRIDDALGPLGCKYRILTKK